MKVKITHKTFCNPRSSPTMRTCRWRGRRRFSTKAWIRRRPQARGLSSSLEIRRSSIRRRQQPPSPDLTPDLRRTRTGSAAPDAGWGSSHTEAPRLRAREKRCSTMDLHRAPPSTRTSISSKTNSGRASIAKAPPSWTLQAPTLYTHWGSGFPPPPAAGAAGGGEGNQRYAGGEVGKRGGSRNRLCFAGRGDVSKLVPNPIHN